MKNRDIKERLRKEFGEKLVSEETSCYLTHNGNIFTKEWLVDFISSEIEKAEEEGFNKGIKTAFRFMENTERTKKEVKEFIKDLTSKEE